MARNDFERALEKYGLVSIAEEHSFEESECYTQELSLVPHKRLALKGSGCNMWLFSTLDNTWTRKDMDFSALDRIEDKFPFCYSFNAIDGSWFSNLHCLVQGDERATYIMTKLRELLLTRVGSVRCLTAAVCISSTSLFLFGGIGEVPKGFQVSLDMSRWKKLPAPPTRRTHATACMLFNTKILIVGGYTALELLKTVEQFDLSTQTWTSLSPMIHGGAKLSLIVCIPYVYAFGAYVQRYNIAADIWEVVVEHPEKNSLPMHALEVISD